MKIFLTLLIVIFSIIGFTEANFITYEKLTGNIPPCQPGFQCATVLEHPMTNIGPVPISALGIVFYSIFLILGVLYYIDFDIKKITSKYQPDSENKTILKLKEFEVIDFMKYLGIIGLLFGTYLIILMAIIIQGWCLYCLISAIICFILFGISQALSKIT